MKSILPAITFLAVHLHPAPATGQSPPSKVPADGKTPSSAPAQPPVALQSLQLLATSTIYHLQPLTADGDSAARGSGTTATVPFAHVRDATFERSGRLIALHVEAVEAKPAQAPVRKLLPAPYVIWDEANRKWLTSDSNLQFAELADVSQPVPATEPASKLGTNERPLLASALLQATWGGFAAAEHRAAAATTPAAAPTAVLWFQPAHLSLAFAVVPHDAKLLPLPWPVLRVKDGDAALQLLVDTSPARLEDSPTCKDALEPPDAATRRRCYVHHGLPIPMRDRTAAEAAEASADHKQPPAKRADREGPRRSPPAGAPPSRSCAAACWRRPRIRTARGTPRAHCQAATCGPARATLRACPRPTSSKPCSSTSASPRSAASSSRSSSTSSAAAARSC